MEKLLKGKNAIVSGGGGGIGSGVAQTFAREGAHVFVTGRTRAKLETVVNEIKSAGGSAEAAALDALDEKAVDKHIDLVISTAGSVDISFNLITRGDLQGIPLVEMNTDDLLRAVTNGLRSNFITARAAARQMIKQHSGVILHLNSASGEGSQPGMGSTGPADAATEALVRYLATELGPYGVRVLGIWTAGVAETLTTERLAVVRDSVPPIEQVRQALAGMAALRRNTTLADVAEVATFLASDRAAAMTGAVSNVTSGLVIR